MYDNMRYKVRGLACALVIGVFGHGVMAAEIDRIFNYHELQASMNDIMHEAKTKGFFIVQGVPGFKENYRAFMDEGLLPFAQLSEEEKNACSIPSKKYTRGWSMGIEKLVKEYADTFKGSYYIKYPDDEANVWPEPLPRFRETYFKLAEIILNFGNEVSELIYQDNDKGELNVLGRALYYKSVGSEENDKNPYWCTPHCDHGYFTILTAETYLKDGIIVPKPKRSGLYILNREITVPDDVVIIQIAETLELISNGALTATVHDVRKAFDGYERFAVAHFFNKPGDHRITSQNPNIIEKYKDRYEPGITHEEWSNRSYKKYNPEEYKEDRS